MSDLLSLNTWCAAVHPCFLCQCRCLSQLRFYTEVTWETSEKKKRKKVSCSHLKPCLSCVANAQHFQVVIKECRDLSSSSDAISYALSNDKKVWPQTRIVPNSILSLFLLSVKTLHCCCCPLLPAVPPNNHIQSSTTHCLQCVTNIFGLSA